MNLKHIFATKKDLELRTLGQDHSEGKFTTTKFS